MGGRVMYHEWDRHARSRIIKQERVVLMPGEAEQLEAIWQKFETEFYEDADAVVYALYFFQKCLSRFFAWHAVDAGITVMEMLSLSILMGVEETNDNNSLSFMKRVFSRKNIICINERRNQLRRVLFQLLDWRVTPTYFQIKAFIKKLYLMLGDNVLDHPDQMTEMQLGFLIDMFENKCLAPRGRHPIWDCLLNMNPAVVKELNRIYDELNQQGLIEMSHRDDALFDSILIYAEACLSGTDKEAPYAEIFSKCVIDYVDDQFIDQLSAINKVEKEAFYRYIQSHYRTFIKSINETDKPWLQDVNLREFLWGLVLKQPNRLHHIPALIIALKESCLAHAFFSDRLLSVRLRGIIDDVLRAHPKEDMVALIQKSLVLYGLKFKLNHDTLGALKNGLPACDYRAIVEYQIRRIIDVIAHHLFWITQESEYLIRAMMLEGMNAGHLVYSLNYLMTYMKNIAFAQVDALLNNRFMLCAYAGVSSHLKRIGLKDHLPSDFIAAQVLFNHYEGEFFTQDYHAKKECCRSIFDINLCRSVPEWDR